MLVTKERHTHPYQAWKPQPGESTDRARLRMITDESCRLIEEGDTSLLERIGVVCLYKENDILYDAETGIPLKDMLSGDGKLDYYENQAFLSLQSQVGKPGHIQAWWSGPDSEASYEESRLNFYITYTGDSLRQIYPQVQTTFVKNNGAEAQERILRSGNLILLCAIPTKHTTQELLRAIEHLKAVYRIYLPENEKDLRSSSFSIPLNNSNWINEISEHVDLPKGTAAWINEGRHFMKRRAKNMILEEIAESIHPEIIKAQTIEELEKIRKRKERQQGEATILKHSSCPPKKLFDKLNDLAEGTYKRVLRCGRCNVWIGRFMKAGDQCESCSGTYLGC